MLTKTLFVKTLFANCSNFAPVLYDYKIICGTLKIILLQKIWHSVYSAISIQANHMTQSTILYADDDLDDLFIVEQAFAPFATHVNLIHATNGIDLLKKLEQLHAKGEEPCLIILDMNMPVMDGRQTLIKLRKSKPFAHLPVALFTTSSSHMDKEFARQWDAYFYTKPVVFDELEQLAKRFITICAEEVSEAVK